MRATLLCTALLIAVLTCCPAEADEVTLKKKDGTAVTGEYLGTVRDGQSVFVQLQVNAQVERHPLADFTASAKKTIVRLNRVAQANAAKATSDAEAAKVKAKAAEVARLKALFEEAFPPAIIEHNTRIARTLRSQAGDDAFDAHFSALSFVVITHSVSDATLYVSGMDGQFHGIAAEEHPFNDYVVPLTPSEFNDVNELLNAGLNQALVQVDGEQQTWKEVWLDWQKMAPKPHANLKIALDRNTTSCSAPMIVQMVGGVRLE